MRRALLVLSVAALLSAAVPGVALAAPSGTAEATYANGTVVYMSAPVRALGDSLLHNSAVATKANSLYLAIYPVAADGFDSTPKTIDGWYSPQCNPCFHFGVPDPNNGQFHDHIVDGAPGFGVNGTAGSYSPAWHAFVVVYNPAYIAAHAATWQPVKSDEALDAAEAAGEFLRINPGASNPYELDTGIVFLCNLTSANAH